MVKPYLKKSLAVTLSAVAVGSCLIFPGAIKAESSNSVHLRSAFSVNAPFLASACKVSRVKPAELPKVFVTPENYTGAREAGDEVRVSQFKQYFMRLSSSARVDAKAAEIARTTILQIAQEDRLRWGENWQKNSTNVFFFTVTALQPVALEYFQQRDLFSAEEQKVIDAYLLRKWKQLAKTKVVASPLEDNKLASYAAFSYTVGLATNNQSAKRAGVKAYKSVIRAMRKDGSNPLDSGRAGSAVHYTNLNISSMVLTAELAMIEGEDLFSFIGRNGGLDQAIDFLIAATIDQTVIAKYARADGNGFQNYSPDNQDLRWRRGDLAAWVAIYARRFPKTDRTLRLLQLSDGQPTRTVLISDHAAGNTLCLTARR